MCAREGEKREGWNKREKKYQSSFYKIKERDIKKDEDKTKKNTHLSAPGVTKLIQVIYVILSSLFNSYMESR